MAMVLISLFVTGTVSTSIKTARQSSVFKWFSSSLRDRAGNAGYFSSSNILHSSWHCVISASKTTIFFIWFLWVFLRQKTTELLEQTEFFEQKVQGSGFVFQKGPIIDDTLWQRPCHPNLKSALCRLIEKSR